MASRNSTAPFNPLTQVFTIIGADGVTEIPVSVDMVDQVYVERFATQCIYGTQIGTTIIMLVLYLLMTPQVKFRRLPTMINILSLIFNIIRCVLLAWFPSSQWFEFYTIWSGDYSHVPAIDCSTSVAGNVSTIPLIMLIEAALMVQAWAMIQLWPAVYKFPALILSTLVALVAVALKFTDSILQAFYIARGSPPVLWVRKIDLAFSSASIFWFCFLFNVRLAIHLWVNRRILPSVKGMSAMEVLVLTNGILMCIPAVFAGLEYGTWAAYEFGSLTYTSVVVVLPLGTLVAQRIANPGAFTAPEDSKPRSSRGNGLPFLKSWHSHTVSSRVESNGNSSRDKNSGPDDGFAKYEGADAEKGVRVARQIEHHEETKE
ncbi:hypothetical protein CONLIGDRAFT_704670 [Coniochaeta ligniaria NRRL 30616]|uniref:Pheromone receptor n=1 Tax=Coniochaeta ligniaria NRRL 30616 TaxID=1408157 RepID=A0A1J7INL3_9PEZI|nr:hypothetical protein CONLIGDRAFT_704670 [Coniochaeta ligniaria NRRL 30616]